ncbi:hypothetical protein BO94DRAFT_590200 [Aspergillus sclerotioniger CBS 115572]|uniref:RNase H type-1 domain-containing protein n=1 Tax=Aspergillus sclerotioniger CBS 115572 TaxID=1450535 RepID=A0A317VCB8_9EURO|nr:hypothetical protein BO94DRAFT_590200 [Aspergillus sclerotioniger CBS 115572]PWY70891.1 hypothetical protein BO94DRAFT_590200 [Aspergillus sclerotioniger CBS 115572]
MKAETSLEALQSISASTWGTSLLNIHKIYNAMRLAGNTIARRAAVQHPEQVQKRAAVLISRAFKSTAGDALNAELHLTPIPRLLEQKAEETAIHMITGLAIGKPCKGQERKPRERRTFLETFEAEIKNHRHRKDQGQGQDPDVQELRFRGHIGAAAVMPRTHGAQERRKASCYLGPETVSNVYAAKLEGLLMATKWATWQLAEVAKQEKKEIHIFSNSQAALKAMRAPKMSSGQYTLTA